MRCRVLFCVAVHFCALLCVAVLLYVVVHCCALLCVAGRCCALLCIAVRCCVLLCVDLRLCAWLCDDCVLLVSAFCLFCVVVVCWLCLGCVVAVPRLCLVVSFKVSSGKRKNPNWCRAGLILSFPPLPPRGIPKISPARHQLGFFSVLILGSQIWNFQNIFLPILVKFRASRTIWRDPVKHTGQNNSEWYRNYPQIRSGGRFLNILGPKKLHENMFSL